MRVLVTGAAGLVGAEVTARLVAAGHCVVALVHRTTELVPTTGAAIGTVPFEAGTEAPVSFVRGDVTQPRLGLAEGEFDALAGTLDRIVHSAAQTDFGLADAVYQASNVDGTVHVLDLAQRGAIPLVHVSTAYVCGEREGVIAEGDLDRGQAFANPYEETKFRAERLVAVAADEGLPVAVVRPSIVVGAERTGVIRDFKNIYVMVKLMAEGKLRLLPGHYNATPNLVPVDYVADVVAEAAGERFAEVRGATLHAVGPRSISLRALSDVMAEYPSFEVARFVPPTSFTTDALPRREWVYYTRVGALYESYLRRRVEFDDAATRAFLRRRPAASGEALLRRLFDHCLRVGYITAAAVAPEPRVAAEAR
jgi:thioester reductase-like protein